MPPPRPRWEANKKVPASKRAKPSRNQSKEISETPAPTTCIPLELQQLLLNIFRNSFIERFSADIKPLIQEVKGHLFNRDFTTAFGKDEYLEAYAARWSASRALGYTDLFWSLKDTIWPEDVRTDADGLVVRTPRRKVVALGGGAGAEIVALGGVQSLFLTDESSTPGLDVVAVDIADWTKVTEALATHTTTAPPLSKYASAAVQANNAALVSPEAFTSSSVQMDILEADTESLVSLLKDASLVTLMFTLNELYSTSLPHTQKLLLTMTSVLPAGAMLLVVDSPGSYSTISLNGTEKKYPMQWLLDHTLLDKSVRTEGERKIEDSAKWEKVQEDESKWFRLDASLKYPIDLENMRVQLHLYRRL